jgi:hypothetical protein
VFKTFSIIVSLMFCNSWAYADGCESGTNPQCGHLASKILVKVGKLTIPKLFLPPLAPGEEIMAYGTFDFNGPNCCDYNKLDFSVIWPTGTVGTTYTEPYQWCDDKFMWISDSYIIEEQDDPSFVAPINITVINACSGLPKSLTDNRLVLVDTNAPPLCPGDLNFDRIVNVDDLIMALWVDDIWELNGVDAITEVIIHWGPCP